MYLGATMMLIGTPPLLVSVFGIFIGVAVTILLIGRIIGEEKALSRELE
jgi:protein-S-isoprenylcysteine O-methyltransferase Ste14